MEVVGRLTKAYGPQRWEPRLGPLDELLFTVLTQHTSDSNAEVAYRSMRSRYPTWEEVLDADTDELTASIRSGGLANQKAPRIQAILGTILERRSSLELGFLGGLPLEEAKEWLGTLPGVGPKTAAVVLAFSLGMPAMPVDTHIYRVSRRLGLLSLRMGVEEAHRVMEAQVPPERIYEYHVLLITHGRQTCKAQRPLCGKCVLADVCPSRPVFERAFARPAYRRPVRGGKPL